MLCGQVKCFSKLLSPPAPAFVSSASLVYLTNHINTFHLRLFGVSLAD